MRSSSDETDPELELLSSESEPEQLTEFELSSVIVSLMILSVNINSFNALDVFGCACLSILLS